MPEKILIVDDDMDTLRLVGIMLERQGYQIIAASNGNQALTLVEKEMPDLILLDIMMPDLSGYEVTKRIRANAATEAIPIIMFTAKSMVDDKLTGFEVGADDYLTKPTQPRELYAHVKAVLARSSKARAKPAGVQADKGYVIGILSAKGGLGNSTLATNLGITLKNRTKSTVIVGEMRPGEGSIGLDLGFTQPEGLTTLMRKQPNELRIADVERELVAHNSGVRFLLSSYQPADARFMSCPEVFGAIAQHLAYLSRYVVLDLGPGLPLTTEKAFSICDDLIVVLEPVPYTITRTKCLLDDLHQKGFGEGRVNLVMVNRIRTEMQLSWSQVKDMLGHDLAITFTPAPELVYQAARNNVPLVIQQPESLTSQLFIKLADSLLKKEPEKA